MTFKQFFNEANAVPVFKELNTPNGIKFGKYVFGKDGSDFEELSNINDLQSAVSSPTYKRLIGLKDTHGAKWERLIKFKNKGARGNSFIVVGEFNKDIVGKDLSEPQRVVYYRKETSSPGAGQTLLYFKDKYFPVSNFLEVSKLDTAAAVLTYAEKIVKGPVPEDLENIILTVPNTAYIYADKILKKRWPKLEEYFTTFCDKDNGLAFVVVAYARDVIKGEFPELESCIAESYYYAYQYAHEVLKRRFPEGEEEIAKNSQYAHYYARDVLKDRWINIPGIPKNIAKKAEENIINTTSAIDYAKDVIKDRWPELEKIIVNDPSRSYIYALNVLKRRWPEAEEAIFNGPPYYKKYYIDGLNALGYSDDEGEYE